MTTLAIDPDEKRAALDPAPSSLWTSGSNERTEVELLLTRVSALNEGQEGVTRPHERNVSAHATPDYSGDFDRQPVLNGQPAKRR
ncbi:hypothetical protein EYF80_038461 [Liparis tanakae]|uniref:Uncharacterized protein n=1 Tax=Liparis tanakae TaxID=230148 RepID=A0A4Z2GEP5_9TELE|nr:hypothetical protein EYF80_038461 [Liparis tanakae]